ncbi:MAG TPA: hypothetical protein VI248_10255 [Kineosporiaceae bacterium]
MAQQLAIIVMVDVSAAVKARTLQGNTYLLDNMKLQGSEGEGTGALVTAINGTHWVDGSMGDEQVLNWLPCALGSIPMTVPRNYHLHRSRQIEQDALTAIRDLGNSTPGRTNVSAELGRIHGSLGTKVRYRRPGGTGRAGHIALDVTGNPTGRAPSGASSAPDHPPLLITDIFGEAVERNVIFPAQYGSPDLVTDGWYWSASVDSTREGVYSYTMALEVHRPIEENGVWAWEPVRLTYQSRLRISNRPKRNAFTGAGVSFLPVPPPEPAAPAGTLDASTTSPSLF